ncbi:MAG TPA: hypothetical protein VK446_12285 [Methylocystis sp.]|nr:hypothetical protein [Methylocystis sp.]
MRRLLLLALSFTLAACDAAPLSTQWRLRSFDLNTADLSQLRLAVRGPEWIVPTPETAALELRYWLGDDESRAERVSLRLHRGAHAGDGAALAQFNSPGALAVYELAPGSLSRAHELQLDALRLKAQGRTHGRIHIAGAVACRRGEIPPGPLLIDAFIHADDETGWLPLLSRYDVRGDMRDPAAEAELERLIPPCGEKSARGR